MDLQEIREFLKIVSESSVAEVEVETKDGLKLVVRKNASSVTAIHPMPVYPPAYPPMPAYPVAPAVQAPPAASIPPQQPTLPQTSSAPKDDPVEPAANEVIVRAPIVGTFYRAPAPDADPYAVVGTDVKPGDIICIIEAMKLMNEIECEETGTIKAVLIDNAEPVEYNQPLFIIEKK